MTEFAMEYGLGLYALAREEDICAPMLAEAEAVKAIFSEQPDFPRLLQNLSISAEERLQVLDSVLRGRVHPYLLNFLKLICERGAIGSYSDCVDSYRAAYDSDYGITEAIVTTAEGLSDKQREAMLTKLKQMTGREIRLKEQTDPSLMGGVVLEMDGRRWDNSARARLEDIHRVISGRG